MSNFLELEKLIGIEFKNKELLKQALTHRSYLNEHPNWGPHNERLEFLGDAVLELVVSEYLYKKFPEKSEGELTMLRASLINIHRLSQLARKLNLDKLVFLSRGERMQEGKAKNHILGNAIEAIIGAIYLDQGYQHCKEFIEKYLLVCLPEIIQKKYYQDPKSLFQEIIQGKFKITPHYEVLEESGPAHRREFRVGLFVGQKMVSEGRGFSKYEAEVEAAKNALKLYEKK